MQASFSIFPLGDNALLVDFGNVIDISINGQVMALFHHIQQKGHPAIEALVPAYGSLAVYYDVVTLHRLYPEFSAFDHMAAWVREEAQLRGAGHETSGRTIKIPVCYASDFGPDMDIVAAHNHLTTDDVIHLHTNATYRVFMIGFLPGFAYMGEVADEIALPRKDQPRLAVPAGSVGIAGKQTGIYPVTSPGGWQIIGRTPLKLFDATQKQPVLLQPGDLITFYPISEHEFAGY